MLGRYVAGTLLVLGGAMLLAPPAPDAKVKEIEVTRAEAAPASLDAVERPRVSKPAASLLHRPASAGETPDRPEPDAVDAAVLEAVRLDMDETVVAARPAAAGSATEPSRAPEAGPDGSGVLAGLDDAGFFAGSAGGRPAQGSDGQSAGRTPAKLLYVTGSRVNVRSGPSTAYRVVGSVGRGDLVELLAYEGADWARIRLNDGDEMGYMSRRYLARSLSDG